jgi:hypothetical protein
MVPKQSNLDTSDTLDYGDFRYAVSKAIKPILVQIVLVLVEVMNDLVHGSILAYKRIFAKRIQRPCAATHPDYFNTFC